MLACNVEEIEEADDEDEECKVGEEGEGSQDEDEDKGGDRVAKCQIFYTEQIFQIKFYPKKRA